MFTNYRYIVTKNKVIALSTYAGRTVRGVAKCSPHDVFDVEKGKKLAAARCNEKVAEKRFARAAEKYNTLMGLKYDLMDRLSEADKYYHDAFCAYNEAAQEVDQLLAKM